MTVRTITDDITGARAGDELAELRMYVRALANQVVCMSLLDHRRTALLPLDQVHTSLDLGNETVKASLALAKDALTFLDGKAPPAAAGRRRGTKGRG